MQQPETEDFRFIPFVVRTIPRLISTQRYLAYTSEVGESFRPLIPKYVVTGTYAASLLYVGADAAHHYQELKDKGSSGSQLAWRTADKLVWHGFASMLLPALTVHSIVSASSRHLFNEWPKTWPKTRAWAPTGFALVCIPFIIHPLDHLIDWAMDNTVRRFYPQ